MTKPLSIIIRLHLMTPKIQDGCHNTPAAIFKGRDHEVQNSILGLKGHDPGSIAKKSHYCAPIISKKAAFSIRQVQYINWLIWKCAELEAGYRKPCIAALRYHE